VHLTPSECEHALKEIDTDPDGESLVNLEMIVVWLEKLGLVGEGIDYHELRTPKRGTSSEAAATENISSETLASDTGTESGA